MQIGDKARDKPTFGDSVPGLGSYTSEVIYIDPQRKFYRARFVFSPAKMTFVETFFLGNRRGDK